MRVEYTIDWLNYTCYRLNRLGWYLIAQRYPNEVWSSAPGRHGYTQAAINNAGTRVMVNPNREDMGQHVTYSGGCLNKYRFAGISAHQITKHHSLMGDTCKRIDLALDAHDGAIDIDEYFKLVDEGSASTRAKSWNIIKSQNGGRTLYIGSRASEVMLRIYDKAAEQGETYNWKRIELEIKGSRAIEVSKMIAVGNEQQGAEIARGMMKALIDFKTPDWTEITGANEVVIAKSKDESPDTELWLMTQVATAMARLIKKQGDSKLLERFSKHVQELVDEMPDTEVE
jgi:replication initiation factor